MDHTDGEIVDGKVCYSNSDSLIKIAKHIKRSKHGHEGIILKQFHVSRLNIFPIS